MEFGDFKTVKIYTSDQVLTQLHRCERTLRTEMFP